MRKSRNSKRVHYSRVRKGVGFRSDQVVASPLPSGAWELKTMQTFTYSPELLAALPPEIAPTMKDAWAAFRFATNDKTNAERESKWFEIIRAVAPGKMQIDFTADEWRQVIAHITNTPNTNH